MQHTDPPLPDCFFALHAKRRAKKSAPVSGDTKTNRADSVMRLDQVGNGFLPNGLEKGDRVVVFMSNGAAMADRDHAARMPGLSNRLPGKAKILLAQNVQG
ncbi:MAG: hypothetical protein GDA35_05055 [Hyphomonadaceae bacterium]|nr:hypothetical protein [Hyphomonadaceae bacterium]